MVKAAVGPRSRRHAAAADAGTTGKMAVRFGQARRRRPFAVRVGRPPRRLSAAGSGAAAPSSLAPKKKPLGDSQAPNGGFDCRLQLPFDTGLLAPDDAKDKVFVAIVKALLFLENVPSNPYELATFIVENDIEHIGGQTPKQTVSSRISQHFKRVSKSLDPQRVATLAKTQSKDSSRKLRYCLNPRAGLPGVPVPRLRPDERLQSDNVPLYTPAKRRHPAGQATPPANGTAAAGGKSTPAAAGCRSCKADRRNSGAFTVAASAQPLASDLGESAAEKCGWHRQNGGECESRHGSDAAGDRGPVGKADGPFPDHEAANREPNKDQGCADDSGSPRASRPKNAGGKCTRLRPGRTAFQGWMREVDSASSKPQPFKRDIYSDDEAPKTRELDPEPVRPTSPTPSPTSSHSEAKPLAKISLQAFRRPDAQISVSPGKEIRVASTEVTFRSPSATPVERRAQTGGQIACSTGVDEQGTLGADPTSPAPLIVHPPSSDAYLTSEDADFALSPLYDAAAPTDEDEDLCKFIQQYSPLDLSCEDFAACSSPYSGPENAWESCPRLDRDVWDVLAVVSWPRADSDPSTPLFHFTETDLREFPSHPLLDVEAPVAKAAFGPVARDDAAISAAVGQFNYPLKVCGGIHAEGTDQPRPPCEILRDRGVAGDGAAAEKSNWPAEQPTEQASAAGPSSFVPGFRHDDSVRNAEVSTAAEANSFCDELRLWSRRTRAAGPLPCLRNGRVAFDFDAAEAGEKAGTSSRPTPRQASSAAALSSGFKILRHRNAAAGDDSEMPSAGANADEADVRQAEGSRPRLPVAEPPSSPAARWYSSNRARLPQVVNADGGADGSGRSPAERRHEPVGETGLSSASRQSNAVVDAGVADAVGGLSEKLCRPAEGQPHHPISTAGPPSSLAVVRPASGRVPTLSPSPSGGSDPSDDEEKRGAGGLGRRAVWDTEAKRKKRVRKGNAGGPRKHDSPHGSSEDQADHGRAAKVSAAGGGCKRQKTVTSSGDAGARRGDKADDAGGPGQHVPDETFETAKTAVAGVEKIPGNVCEASLRGIPARTGSSAAAKAEPSAANGTAAILRTAGAITGTPACPPVYMTVIDLVSVYAAHVTVKAPGSSSPGDGDGGGMRRGKVVPHGKTAAAAESKRSWPAPAAGRSPAAGEFVTCKLLRMVDSGFVNGTALLQAGHLGECERSAVLSLEVARIYVRKEDSELNGTWIPLERARELAATFSLLGKVGAFLDDDLPIYFSSAPPPSPPAVFVSRVPGRRRRLPLPKDEAPEPAPPGGGGREDAEIVGAAEEFVRGGRESRLFRPDWPASSHGRIATEAGSS